MGVAATIAVSLIARAERFEPAFRRAAGVVGGLSSSLMSLAGPLARIGGLFSVLAGGGLTIVAAKTAATIDEMAKLADRLGTTTEALAGLHHAANINGASAEALNKGLEQLSKRLGEASMGTGEAQRALKVLGLELRDLLGKDPATAFALVADRVAQLGSAQERAAVAAQLFGRGGLELLNTLALGSEGLAKMREEADLLGLTFSRVDAAKVEAANDAITRVKALVAGAFRTAVIELAPYVEAVANRIVAWGTAGDGVGPKVLDLIRSMVSGVGYLAQAFQVTKGAFEVMLGSMTMGLGTLLETVALVVDGLTDLVEWIPGVDFDFDQDFRRFSASVTEWGFATTEAGAEAIATSADARRAMLAWFDDTAAAAKRNAEAVTAAGEAAKRASSPTLGALAPGGPASFGAAGAEADKEAKALKAQAEALQGIYAERLRVLSLSREDRQYAQELKEIEQARKIGLTNLALAMEALLKWKREEAQLDKDKAKREADAAAAKAAAEAAKARAEAQAQQVAAMKDALTLEIKLARAASDEARERIRIEDELARRLKVAGDDQEARALALAAAAERLRQLAEDRAAAEARSADAMKEQADAARKAADAAAAAAKKVPMVAGREQQQKAGGGGGGAGGGILGFGAKGEIVYEDGRVDKGLARRRQRAKAVSRLQKLQRQGGGPFSVFGGALGTQDLREADTGLGGLISGRSLAVGGPRPFSGAGPEAKHRPATDAVKAPGAAPGGPAQAPEIPDASPAIKAAKEALEDVEEKMGAMAEASNELSAAAESASGEAKGALAEAAKKIKETADAQRATADELKAIRAALEAIQAHAPG